MFVLAAKIHRSGAVCREYFQPEETGIVPGVVFGFDGPKRAKQYQTEEEAVADIPAFRQVTGFNDLHVDVVPI